MNLCDAPPDAVEVPVVCVNNRYQGVYKPSQRRRDVFVSRCQLLDAESQ